MDVGAPADAFLVLRGLTRRFGPVAAVDGVDLDIWRGETFALLGPSGCGKSTTLRMIAGLDEPDEGLIRLADRTLFKADAGIHLPPQKRNMGMVFQSYAIWPHLTVAETVAYPLDIRRVSRADRADRARAVIRQVGLSGLEERPSSMLSGGQQQRVALARALVYEPDILLLDEPFSNLDLRVREQMRVELKLLQRRLGVTVILVTHDQVEALSLSDRIAVMNAGKVEQVGSPADLYDRPRTAFVRDFIGAFVKIRGTIEATGGRIASVLIDGTSTRLRGRLHEDFSFKPSDRVVCAVRPEQIALNARDNEIEATVETLLFIGERHDALLRIGDQSIATWLPRAGAGAAIAEGDRISLSLPETQMTIWPF